MDIIECRTKEIKENKILKIINQSFLNNPDTIKCVSEIKDFSNELCCHSINVALLSLLVAIKQGKRTKELEDIYISGLLHDYGKLLIPRDLLEKEGRLTVQERGIIELHPAAGFLTLKRNTKLSENIIYAVLDHHEKEDGSGYTTRKNSTNISKYSKLISVVDVYDAMVSDRAYRTAIDSNVVKDHLLMCAGRSLDYDNVISLIDLIETSNVKDLEQKYFSETLKLHELYKNDFENGRYEFQGIRKLSEG